MHAITQITAVGFNTQTTAYNGVAGALDDDKNIVYVNDQPAAAIDDNRYYVDWVDGGNQMGFEAVPVGGVLDYAMGFQGQQ